MGDYRLIACREGCDFFSRKGRCGAHFSHAMDAGFRVEGSRL